MKEFKELTNVIEKYNEILTKYNSDKTETTKEEVNYVCGVSFEMAKALVLNYPDLAVKVAKMILAYKELDLNDIRVRVE